MIEEKKSIFVPLTGRSCRNLKLGKEILEIFSVETLKIDVLVRHKTSLPTQLLDDLGEKLEKFEK